ncbi:hypothetical protein BGZ81_004881 [Podila clonocystis]|nr:hypothetical protein BGZ81_004881 [Podila clonocystis]
MSVAVSISTTRTNQLLHKAETTIGIDCLAPERREDKVTVQCAVNASLQHKWRCILRNKDPQLEIQLSWTCQLKYSAYLAPPTPFQSVRIISREGRQICGDLVNGLGAEAIHSVRVDMEAVRAGDRLEFDIILSTSNDSKHVSSMPERLVPTNDHILATLMKDINTMDIRFTFGSSSSDCKVSLWAHQAVLAHQPALARLIDKLRDIEGESSSHVGKTLSRVLSTHITEYTLESYCCLIRYLYTGAIILDVDLSDFAIGYLPSEPFAVASKTRISVKGLFGSASTPSSRSSESSKGGSKRDLSSKLSSEVGSPGSNTASMLWKDVFQVADCHDVKELRDYCRDKIIADLCVSNVLEILFEFGYRYSDLKEEVLKFLADHIGQMYARDSDPFSAYVDHPHRYALLAEALRPTIPASEVEQDNEYRFCVVVSSRPDILELFPWQNVTLTPPIVETVEPEPVPFDNDIMMTLLKDTYSVDTQFLFSADDSLADVGLWAHRSILSRYQVFRDLIEQTSAARSSSTDGGSEFSPLTLTVDKISLATFCVVLMFIYSGKIERTVDPSKFAISKPQTSLMVHDTAGRVKDTFCWHPLDSDSPWSLKPVTWSELLIAADIYMIEALHARCQEKVIEDIDESSVVETLFRVGGHSPGVKIAAINFIAKNMGTLLTNGKDPFLEFADEKNCHDMMVEVMRARVREL